MKYVALLRGINVGGKAKVEMPRLKGLFETMGCQQVLTYINSGNVLLSDTRKISELMPLIETAIVKEFGLHVRVLRRDLENVSKVCREVPATWTNDTEQKTDVLFLWDEIDSQDILNKVVINPVLEIVRYISGALVWNIGRANVTKGNGIKLIKTDLYKHMTGRNINNVRKLNKRMVAK